MAKWRNWQTQQTQNLPYFTVRVGSTPTFATTILSFLRGREPKMPKKYNFYVKVLVVEQEEGEVNPDRYSREITRQLEKMYGVKVAEVTNVTAD